MLRDIEYEIYLLRYCIEDDDYKRKEESLREIISLAMGALDELEEEKESV